MPLLNYSTSVDTTKTVSEIQTMLGRAGVEHVLISYENHNPVSLTFAYHANTYRLPCRSDAVYSLIMLNSAVPKGLRTHKQALRIAWRILKDWTAAQLALIQAEMVSLDEVFLPYLIVNDHTHETVYEAYQLNQKLIEKKA